MVANRPVYEILADAFVAEGVDTQFTLLGDANMHWVTALSNRPEVRTVHARHEHCATMMALGYAKATGKVGIASTTCGPGFTQIMTALAVAARGYVPLIVFAGDTPQTGIFSVQEIDQGPLALATGAHYIPVRHVDRALDCIRQAFYVASVERRPVVLSVPTDIQYRAFPHLADYAPSTELVPTRQRPMPDPEIIEQAVKLLSEAERVMIIAGRGAVQSGAGPLLEEIAAQTDALLATTMLAKGLFDPDPFGIGIAGAYSSDVARQHFAEAEIVLGVGAGLGFQTTEAGYLYPNAKVITVDTRPRGLWQGMKVADLHITADAKAASAAILEGLRRRSPAPAKVRSKELAATIAAQHYDTKPFPAPPPGILDPREALLELDRVVPRDWDIVVGLGHHCTFALNQMRNRAPERWHVISDFGTIGSGLSAAIGVAAARGDGKVLLVEGDGSVLMHIQELETIERHGLRLVMAVMNDGAYGAELHRLRAHKIDERQSVFGRRDIGRIARGFGIAGEAVKAGGRLAGLLAEYEHGNSAALWDLHVDDKIPSPQYRRVVYGEA